MRPSVESGLAAVGDAKREVATRRDRFMERLSSGSRALPVALVSAFMAACAAGGPRSAKAPKSGEGGYGFVLGTPQVGMDEVRSDVQKRLAGQGQGAAKGGEPPKISDVGFEIAGGQRIAAAPPSVAREEAGRGTPVEGFERAGIPSADIRHLVEALPGRGFVAVRYATTCERRPNPGEMGRQMLTSVEIPVDGHGVAQWDKPGLIVYGSECFGNTPQARGMFMNYLGQEIGMAYAFANMPVGSDKAQLLKALDALMAPHRGPEVNYAPGPVFDEPILNGYVPQGLGGDQLRLRQQQVYWASLVNAALHSRFASPRQDWREAFMLRLTTTHRAPAEKAQVAAELVAGFFAAQDKDADPNKFIRDFQAYEEHVKMPMCQREVQSAIAGTVKDEGLRALLLRAWRADVTERATYLDFSPRVKRPTGPNDRTPDQRTPFMRQNDDKLEKAEAVLRERAVQEPKVAAVVLAALDFAHELSEVHRHVANSRPYAQTLGARVAQASSRLDAAYGTLSPQDKERATPFVIQALRVVYYGDPIKQ